MASPLVNLREKEYLEIKKTFHKQGVKYFSFFCEESRYTAFEFFSDNSINFLTKFISGLGITLFQDNRLAHRAYSKDKLYLLERELGIKEDLFFFEGKREQEEKQDSLDKYIDSVGIEKNKRIRNIRILKRKLDQQVWAGNIYGNFGHEKRVWVQYKVQAFVKYKDDIIELERGGGFSKDNEFHLKHYLEDLIKISDGVISNAKEINFGGEIPIILSSGEGNVLFHEVLGHPLESDYVIHNISPIKMKMLNQKIAPDFLTVFDLGSIDQERSCFKLDDEGFITKSKILIENGVLRNFITDGISLLIYQSGSGGNSRRESFLYPPLPRVSSLSIREGKYDEQEMIESIKKGIFINKLGNGEIKIQNGYFSFQIKESFFIENGKLKFPLVGGYIKGNLWSLLENIEMIGKNKKFDSGLGYCRKKGQNLIVRVSGPSIKIKKLFYYSKKWS
ncbi:MAG: TldD/PmbA family protein [Acidobacteriota bacterium]